MRFEEIHGESLNLGAGFIECAGAIDGVGGALEFFFERPGAIDGVGGVLEFFVDRKLSGHAAAGFGFAHTSGAKSFELLLRRAPGDDQAVQPGGHAGFDKQCGFDESG